MSEPSNGAWPFQEIPEEEGLDISAIFGDSSAAPQGDPFAPPAAAQSVPSSPTPVAQEITPAVAATSQPTTAPIAKAPVEAPAENPIAAAFEQKTAENTKKGLLEKPPVFYHKGVKEEIDDPSMTFEELRIRKSDDFTDLEEGKRVSWSVEYCGIRKEVKDPKGTTIISMKEMIERSREFLDALKKTKDKDPCCYVKPKVEMKTKGNAAYKGKFGTLEEARNSDKVMRKLPGMNAPILPNCGNSFRPCGKRSPAEKWRSTSPNSRKRWRKRLPESKTWVCGISGKTLHIRRFTPVWSVLPVTGA